MMARRSIWVATLVIAAAIAATIVLANPALVCRYTPEWKSMREANIEILNDHGDSLPVQVRVAADAATRAAGFQHICPAAIEANRILFVFPEASTVNFHMHNVQGALDIAFFNSDGHIVSIAHMSPYESGGPRPLYGPATPIRYALEAAPGFFAARGVSTQGGRLLLKSLSGL